MTTIYMYDKGHNRTSKTVNGVTTTYVIGNGSNGAGANQIVSETTGDVTTAYGYDANGNRTSRTIDDDTDTYSYDNENRLITLDYETGESDTGTYTYGYDYRTRRVARTEPGPVATHIVFDGGVSIIEYGAAGAPSPNVEYVRGHDYGGGVGGLEYSIRGGTPSFNFYDSRGDVTTQTGSTGAVTFQAAYEAFGSEAVTSGSTLDRQKANTKEQDPTGLLKEGFRYRDPSTGTFLSRDPLGFKAGPNMYTYVRQNPWTHFDPEGLDDNSKHPHPPPPKEPAAHAPSAHASTNAPSSPKPAQSPSPAKSAKNQSFTTTNVTTDFDGAARAYAPPGSGLHGEDHLGNARMDHGKGPLNPQVLQMDKNGNPVKNKEGFYVSNTSLTDPHGHPLNADAVPYIALGNQQAHGAKPGDRVTVTSQPLDAHGKPLGTPVTKNTVYGDSRLGNNKGAEMSPALEHGLGITTGKYGVVTSHQRVTVTPHPGTRTSRHYTGQ